MDIAAVVEAPAVPVAGLLLPAAVVGAAVAGVPAAAPRPLTAAGWLVPTVAPVPAPVIAPDAVDGVSALLQPNKHKAPNTTKFA